jgi:hypothetical protein
VARQEGNRVVVDIIDPHNHGLPDALGKAQRLAEYARDFAEKVGHVDILTTIRGRRKRLHLDDVAIRDQVLALRNNNELDVLYRREGR